MKRWIKGVDLSRGLQLSFWLSALLCLFVGGVGLFTWQQQRVEIHIALSENFPKVQSAFQVEEQVNLLHNAFVQFSNAKTTSEKVEFYQQTQQYFTALFGLLTTLKESVSENLPLILIQQSHLLEQLSDTISAQLTLNEAFNHSVEKMNWLDKDFKQEFTALLQEISWQQSTLAKNIAKNPQNRGQLAQLNHLQQQLVLVNDFIQYEEQLIVELRNQINEPLHYQLAQYQQQLHYLALLIHQRLEQLQLYSSTATIKQILNELLEMGLKTDQLPDLFRQYQILHQQKQKLISESDELFAHVRQRIREQVGSSKNQLDLLQQIVEKSTQFKGILILLAMLSAFVLVVGVNFFYIRLRLLKRFEALNHAVLQLSKGEEKVKIPVYGSDELGRIARLLRLFLFEMAHKQAELTKRNQVLMEEIDYRIKVQAELVETQQELTQTAKLAVVGKTMTSISHEITQPLNAMNAYLFSARRALQKQDSVAVADYLAKITHLVEKTALMIKRLRQFSRQGRGDLQIVDLKLSFANAWELLESKHLHRQAQLKFPENLPHIWGENVLIEQVLVNIFLNALEAIEQDPPQIEVEIYQQDINEITLWISDNGKGWPLEHKLLQPFSSSKSLNLGLGLSISQSIMQQCGGELHIASTITRNALIILKFKVVQYAE
ncbi:MAG: ATP-binding protein [Lonepinella koalarum]|nr:ATP-binding protein [Lonepinella koalarum]